MTTDHPTYSQIAEENIRGYIRRKQMKTVYHTSPGTFCVECKVTGGEYGTKEEYWCMALECPTPERRCEFVKHKGVRT